MHMLKSLSVNERPCRIAVAQTILMRAQSRSGIAYRTPFLGVRWYTTTNRSSSSSLIVIVICANTTHMWPCTAIEAEQLHLLRLCVFVYPQNG